MLLGFDWFCWQRIAAQIAAKNYFAVTGQVIHVPAARPSTNFLNRADACRYGYRVNGKGYAGTTYRYVETTPPAEVAAQLWLGKGVSVYYNPDNPADAVLSRELTDQDYGRMLQLGLLNLMVFSFLGLWSRWRVRTIFPADRIWQS